MNIINFNELKQDYDINKLEITPYLTLTEKELIINGTEEIEAQGIVNSIIKENKNGLFYIDNFSYEMLLTYYLLNYYANVQFEGTEFTVEDYDWIHSNNVFSDVVEKVGKDYEKFVGMLDKSLNQEVEQRNSLQSVIIKSVDKFIGKLDELSNPKKLKALGKVYQDIVGKNPELLSLLENAKQLGVAK